MLIGWTFFRARSLDDAMSILAGMFHLGRLDLATFKALNLTSFELPLSVFQILILLGVDLLLFARPDLVARLRANRLVAMTAAVLLFYDIMLFGIFEKADFIYFQF